MRDSAVGNSVAKFAIGQVIRHRWYGVRGVVFDVDPAFRERERWRGTVDVDEQLSKDQPFYYLFASTEQHPFIAYVPEQSLVADFSGEPVHHPQISELFERDDDGRYRYRGKLIN